MPSLASIVKRVFLHQKLVFWAKLGVNGSGQPVYDVNHPLQLDCRWEDKQQEIITMDGRVVHSKGYLLMIYPVTVGSMVFLGTILQLKTANIYPRIPTVNEGGREIILVANTPDLKATSSIYEVYL